MRLEGKVALISGAAGGQGAAEARMFAGEGAKVILADVMDQKGTSVAAEIREAGGDALFVHLDVTDESEWDAAVQMAVTTYGKLDILVNNAGIWRGGQVLETSSEHWDDIFAVNAKGVFLGTKAAIPEMRKAGGGSIINISSIASLVGGRGSTAYAASKGAVRIFSKSTAIQYASEGIRANSIHPGAIDVNMGQFNDPGSRERWISATPLGRIASPQAIAYGALYLASDESSFVTGSELVIDGGLTAQ
jgi:cyclopentanol dehydrogenase